MSGVRMGRNLEAMLAEQQAIEIIANNEHDQMHDTNAVAPPPASWDLELAEHLITRILAAPVGHMTPAPLKF